MTLSLLGAVERTEGASTLLSPARALELAARADEAARGRDARPSWLPGTHRLLYSALDDDGRPVVFSLDADNGRISELMAGCAAIPSPDGRYIAFLREPAAGPSQGWQLWVADPQGRNARRLIHAGDEAASGTLACSLRLSWSPDSSRLLYRVMVTDPSIRPDASDSIRASTNSTAEVYPRAQSGSHTTSSSFRLIDVAAGTEREVYKENGPSHSFGWLNATTIYYERADGKPHPEEKHTLIVALDLQSGREARLVGGYQRQAVHSAIANRSGSRIAFIADPGEEAPYPHRSELAVVDVASREVRLLTRDAFVKELSFAPDDNGIAYVEGPPTKRNLRLMGGSGKSDVLTHSTGVDGAVIFSADGKRAAWIHTDANMRTTLRVADWSGRLLKRIHNAVVLEDPLAGLQAGVTRAIEWESRDALTIDGYLTLPPDYDASRRYPLVVMIHGGPLGALTAEDEEWPSSRYFPYVLASAGYAVFRPSYRSSGMYGFDKILEARRRGQPMRADFDDIASGIDYLERNAIADPAREFLLGHSHGSTLANWIVAHSKRFRAAISYEGGDYLLEWGGRSSKPYNLTTIEWLLQGRPFDGLEVYRENSAVLDIKGARTPTLFINAEHGVNAPSHIWLYNALRVQGVEAAFVYYRDEGHVVSKPQNRADLLQRILDWLACYRPVNHSVACRLKKSSSLTPPPPTSHSFALG